MGVADRALFAKKRNSRFFGPKNHYFRQNSTSVGRIGLGSGAIHGQERGGEKGMSGSWMSAVDRALFRKK